MMAIKKCADCGEPFIDESLFLRESKCDDCARKVMVWWDSNGRHEVPRE